MRTLLSAGFPQVRGENYVFSGVRPASGAETLENSGGFEASYALEGADVAAAEDGRTPANKYGQECPRYGHDNPPVAKTKIVCWQVVFAPGSA